jgi:CheY-like chemotaxis protein
MENRATLVWEKFRILCVDDDADGLKLRRAVLELEGYSVITATEPMKALENDFSLVDLVVVDYDMPELNGRDLLLRMRSAKVACPIILLSGQACALPMEVRILFSACINKGAPLRDLLEIIDRFQKNSRVEDLS